MRTRGPSIGQVGVAVAFAFSCFGLLLFLWVTFGGPVPLKPEGYRVKVPVSEAAQLAQEADVRIHGVSVGKVKSIDLENSGPNRDLALATLEINSPYAPLPADTRAQLREKTLLGETYVELTQGDRTGPKVPEGGTLPRAQVQSSVQLDEIFRTFDAKTRTAFQSWMQQLAIASAGRGADLSAAIANLAPFAEDANKVLQVLDTQQGAVQQLVRNTGEVFGALSERQGQLQGLIRNSGTVFHTTAVRNRDLQAAFEALPTFESESQLTLNRLESFATNANPVITHLHPAARQLSKDLKPIAKVSPSFNGFFIGLRKTEKRGTTGLPALQRLLNTDLPPLLTQLHPFTQQLTPLVAEIGRYQHDITGLLGNATGTTQAQANTEADVQGHYIRSSAPLFPEDLGMFGPPGPAISQHPLAYSRLNPYTAPNSALKVAGGLDSFLTASCSNGITASLGADGTYTGNPNFADRATFDTPQQLLDQIKADPFRGGTGTSSLPSPPCTKQPQQPSLGQVPELSDYTHVYANP
jgi:phospholipid/cholesterol/gamma-HCH transport system substrate-binding protein